MPAIVFSSLLVGCSEEESMKSENEITTEEPATVEVKEKVTTEKPTTEKPKNVASENNVYGPLKDKGAKEAGAFYVNDSKGISYLGDKDDIYQIEKTIDKNLGITVETDLNFLMQHAMDYMEDDATQTQQLSDSEFTYESKRINKEYSVTFSRPDGKTVERIIVSQK